MLSIESPKLSESLYLRDSSMFPAWLCAEYIICSTFSKCLVTSSHSQPNFCFNLDDRDFSVESIHWIVSNYYKFYALHGRILVFHFRFVYREQSHGSQICLEHVHLSMPQSLPHQQPQFVLGVSITLLLSLQSESWKFR